MMWLTVEGEAATPTDTAYVVRSGQWKVDCCGRVDEALQADMAAAVSTRG